MKETLEKILEEYLKVFPEEKERQNEYKKYLKSAKGDEVADWNNFNGHTVATGFIYNKNTKKFLVVHHRDLDMYLSPGGHVDLEDENPLNTAKREVKEETGLDNLEYMNVNEKIKDIINNFDGQASVFAVDEYGNEIKFNENKVVESASCIKVFILIEYYRQIMMKMKSREDKLKYNTKNDMFRILF